MKRLFSILVFLMLTASGFSDTNRIRLCDFIDLSKFAPDAYFDLNGSTNPPVQIPSHYVCMTDQKGTNISGGSFTNGAWQTRDLNIEQSDYFSYATLSSNQVSLTSGIWRCHISVPGYKVDGHVAKLQDISGGRTLLMGSSSCSGASDSTVSLSFITGSFVLLSNCVLEVQHMCDTTRAPDGFGASLAWATNTYTLVEFWRTSW